MLNKKTEPLPVETHFSGTPLNRPDILNLFLPGLVGVSMPLGYGIWRSNYGYTHFGPVAARIWGLPYYIMACVALLAFLWLSLRRLTRAHSQLTVSSSQIAIQIPFRKEKTVLWENVHGIFIKPASTFFPNSAALRIDLQLKSGRRISLSKFTSPYTLLNTLQAYRAPTLLPQLNMLLNSGKTVTFGPIQVSKQGLYFQNTSYSWPEVLRVELKNGRIMIELAHEPIRSFAISRIPDMYILLKIIHHGGKAL